MCVVCATHWTTVTTTRWETKKNIIRCYFGFFFGWFISFLPLCISVPGVTQIYEATANNTHTHRMPSSTILTTSFHALLLQYLRGIIDVGASTWHQTLSIGHEQPRAHRTQWNNFLWYWHFYFFFCSSNYVVLMVRMIAFDVHVRLWRAALQRCAIPGYQ